MQWLVLLSPHTTLITMRISTTPQTPPATTASPSQPSPASPTSSTTPSPPSPPSTTTVSQPPPTTTTSTTTVSQPPLTPPIHRLHDTSPLFKCLIEGDASYAEHYIAQREYPTAYTTMLKAICERGLGMPRKARARTLAAFWVHKNWKMSEYLLTMPSKAMLDETTGSDLINFVDFCSAVKLLDAPRLLRAKRKKLAALEAKQTARAAAAAEAEVNADAAAAAVDAATKAQAATTTTTAAAAAATPAAEGWGGEAASGSDGVLPADQAALLLPPTTVYTPKKITIFSTDAKLRRRIGELRSEINALETEQVDQVTAGSMSGSLSKGLRKVVARIPATKLEFFALQLGLQGWRELADVLHINPSNMAMPGFMARVFGGDNSSQNERLQLLKTLARDNAAERVLALAPSYEFLRTKVPDMDDATKLSVAKTAPIDTCLWWLDELATEEVCDVVAERLDNGEQPTLSLGSIMQLLLSMYQSTIPLPVQSLVAMGFGRRASDVAAARYPNLDHAVEWLLSGAAARYQDDDAAAAADTAAAAVAGGGVSDAVVDPVRAALFERLLPLADAELAKVSLPLASPTVVIGDSSASMDVAIRTSVIISALMSHLCDADLWFFSDTATRAPVQPKNVAEALEVAMNTKASGCTSPAAALWPFYREKRRIAVLVVVTDEEENEKSNGFSFAELFSLYRAEVNPFTKVVFVSFIASGNGGGMVSELKETGVSPLVFTFDPVRPDLTKLDNLFAILSIHTDAFNAEIQTALQADFDASSVVSVVDGADDNKTLVDAVEEQAGNVGGGMATPSTAVPAPAPPLPTVPITAATPTTVAGPPLAATPEPAVPAPTSTSTPSPPALPATPTPTTVAITAATPAAAAGATPASTPTATPAATPEPPTACAHTISPVNEKEAEHEVLTAAALDGAAAALKKKMLGNHLFPKVESMLDDKSRAGKITGMLLELNNADLLRLLADEAALAIAIKDAAMVFDDFLKSENR